MAQLIRHTRISAFTLFESVVAIAVISVLIGIVTITYSNLVGAEKPIAFYQAKEEVDRYFEALKTSGAFFPASYDHETYTITQSVDFHQGNKKIYCIDYTISAGGKTWWTEKHLLANPYEK